MGFVFPQDINHKAGAVRVTQDGANFYVPVVLFCPDGLTPLTVSNPLPVQSVVGGAAVSASNPLPTQLTGTNNQVWPSTQTVMVSNWPSTQNVTLTGANNQVQIVNSSGASASVVGPQADNAAMGNVLEVLGYEYLYNGSAWDRFYNNTQGTLLASATRTTTGIAPIMTNYNSRGVQVYLNVTAASGTGGLQVQIQGVDPVTGYRWQLNETPPAVTAVGEYIYELYPGATGASGTVVQRTSGALPRLWSVVVVAGDNSPYTYSVGYALIN